MKITLVGAGRIAWQLEKDPLRYKPCTHLGALLNLIKRPRSVELLICDIDKNKAEQAVDWVGEISPKVNCAHTSDYRAAIETNPELIIIAADTSAHFEIMQAALKKKTPKIVVEKPLVLNAPQVELLKPLITKSGAQIWINYERRYHKKYERLKQIINNKFPYGKPLHYRGWFASPHQHLKPRKESEGVLLHDTTHLLDLAQFLFGPAKTGGDPQAGGDPQSKQKDKKQTTSLIPLKHKNISGEILTTAGSKYFHFEMEIIFEKARIRAGNGFLDIEKCKKSPYYTGFKSLDSVQTTPDKKMVFNDNPFVRLYKQVLSNTCDPQAIKDGCDNIKILS